MNLPNEFRARPMHTWWRGGQWKLEFLTREGQQTPVKVVIPVHRSDYELVDPPGSMRYDPVRDAPDAYLAFAAIRKDLWFPRSKRYSIDHFWPLLTDFFEQYGHPLHWGRSRLDEFFTPDYILNMAKTMAVAVKCYQCLTPGTGRDITQLRTYISDLLDRNTWPVGWTKLKFDGNTWIEGEPDISSDQGVLECATTVMLSILNDGLRGVHLHRGYDPKTGWTHYFSYDNLIHLMYLQLDQAVDKQNVVRECEGCGILFEAHRTNQHYHSVLCRGAANTRKTYHRKKNGGMNK